MREESSIQRHIAAVSAVLMAIVFLVSGIWKVLSPYRAGELLVQAKVPDHYGVLGASALGSIEIFAAVLLLLPQFRRWGGLLSCGLIVFFMAWVGYYYHSLVGQECSCFPIIKRTIGPGFFVGDGVMLILSLVAFLWSPTAFNRITRVRVPAVLLVAIAVLAGVSFGVNAAERQHAQVPVPVTVDNQAADLTHGKVFLFFYDPSCEHCDAAARFMSKLNWGDTRIVAIPTVTPQWAPSFLHDTQLKAGTSLEVTKLKKAFPFGDPPYGVALDEGRVQETFGQVQFTPPQPSAELKKLGFLH